MPDYYNQMKRDCDHLNRALETGTTPPPAEFRARGYQMDSPGNFGFYQLTGINASQHSDWKFHMSIHPEDIPAAWNMAVEELTADETGRHLAKVVKPRLMSSFNNPDNIQAGKMITLYATDDYPPEHYMELVDRLERRFQAAGIRPAAETNADRKIPGALYSSYRRETDPNGRYMASVDFSHLPPEQRYNPHNAPDPYENMVISGVRHRVIPPTPIPIAPDLPPLPAPSTAPHAGPQATASATGDFSPTIGNTPWIDVRDGAGNMAKYANVEKLGEGQLARLQEALADHNIPFILKRSSLEGGMQVLAVGGAKALEVGLHQERAQAAPALPAAPQSPTFSSAIGDMPWIDVRDRDGQMAKYVDVQKMSDDQLEKLQSALSEKGLPFEFKRTSLDGGMQVLAVKGENAVEVTKHQIASSEHLLAHAPWVDVQDRHGQPAKYLKLDGMSDAEQGRFENAAKVLGLSTEVKDSSMDGGCRVLATAAGPIDTLKNRHAAPSAASPHHGATPPPRPMMGPRKG